MDNMININDLQQTVTIICTTMACKPNGEIAKWYINQIERLTKYIKDEMKANNMTEIELTNLIYFIDALYDAEAECAADYFGDQIHTAPTLRPHTEDEHLDIEVPEFPDSDY